MCECYIYSTALLLGIIGSPTSSIGPFIKGSTVL